MLTLVGTTMGYSSPIVIVVLGAFATSAARLAGYPRHASYLIVAVCLLLLGADQFVYFFRTLRGRTFLRERGTTLRPLIAIAAGICAVVFTASFWETNNLISPTVRSIAEWQDGPVRVIVTRDGRLDLGASHAATEVGRGSPSLLDLAASRWLRAPLSTESLTEGTTLLVKLSANRDVADVHYLKRSEGRISTSLTHEYGLRGSSEREKLRRLLAVAMVDVDAELRKRPLLSPESMSDEAYSEFAHALSGTVMTSPYGISLGVAGLRKAVSVDPSASAAKVELANALSVALSRGWIELLSPAPRDERTTSASASTGELAASLAVEGFTHAMQALQADPFDSRAWMSLGKAYAAANTCRQWMSDESVRELESILCQSSELLELPNLDAANHDHCFSKYAEGALQRAVELDPGCASAWNSLVGLYALSGRKDQMERCLDRAKLLIPQSPMPEINSAIYSLRKAKGSPVGPERFELLSQALSILDSGIARNASIGAAYYNRACARLLAAGAGPTNASIYESALSDLRQAVGHGDLNYPLLLRTDPDLSLLRNEQPRQFADLLAEGMPSGQVGYRDVDGWLVDL